MELSTLQNIQQSNNAWSAQQAQKQMDFQASESNKLRDFNMQQAKINRDWQEMMSNTAHQREIIDLKKAGLNPVLSAGGNGASVTSGSAASQSSSGQGSKGDTDTSIIPALASMTAASITSSAMVSSAALQAQASRDIAEINAKNNIERQLLSNIQSGMNTFVSSSATRYSANKNAEASKFHAIAGILPNLIKIGSLLIQ